MELGEGTPVEDLLSSTWYPNFTEKRPSLSVSTSVYFVGLRGKQRQPIFFRIVIRKKRSKNLCIPLSRLSMDHISYSYKPDMRERDHQKISVQAKQGRQGPIYLPKYELLKIHSKVELILPQVVVVFNHQYICKHYFRHRFFGKIKKEIFVNKEDSSTRCASVSVHSTIFRM